MNYYVLTPLMTLLLLLVIFIIKYVIDHKKNQPASVSESDSKEKKSNGIFKRITSGLKYLRSVLVGSCIFALALWGICAAFVGMQEAIHPTSPWAMVGEMSYTPNKNDWTTVTTQIPSGGGICRVRAIAGYNHFYTDDNRGEGALQYVRQSGNSIATNVNRPYKQYGKLAQLIKINGQITEVVSYDFKCTDKIRAMFRPNVTASAPQKNTGMARFVIERRPFQ